MHESGIHIYPIDHPGDANGLQTLIDSDTIDPRDIQGIQITHEGDLPGNAFAMLEVARVLGKALGTSRQDVIDTVPIQALAGANGFMVPHTAVFTRKDVSLTSSGETRRFVVAGRNTRRFEPEEVGTLEYVREVRDATRGIMNEMGLSTEDVHLVFAKTPWPNPDRFDDSRRFVAADWWEMLQFAQGGAALGVSLGIGELSEDEVTIDRIGRDLTGLYSTIAQCSSTEDRESVAVIVFGNSTESTSSLVIGHGMLEDGFDVPGVKTILRTMGFGFDCCPSPAQQEKIRYGWLKPKTSEMPTLRGYRHTLRTHSMLGPFWWMVEKAPVHAVVASVLGQPVLEVATGSAHQGAVGQPLLAILAEAQ